ncbi:MAG: hypothetical protein WCB68_09950 [Pyrinomonadaceae bacterium]
MSKQNFLRKGAGRGAALCLMSFVALLTFSQSAWAATWNGIEPLKSRRADVERILGKPITDQPGQESTLQFKVAGGEVTVTFVTARFIANKKLFPELEGTVLQVVLQHSKASDTPESLGLPKKSDFEREDIKGGTIYRNLKDGIVYTFLGGKLITTRYSPSADQFARAQKGK